MDQGVAVRARMTSESHPQLTEQETDGDLVKKDAKTLSCSHFLPLLQSW